MKYKIYILLAVAGVTIQLFMIFNVGKESTNLCQTLISSMDKQPEHSSQMIIVKSLGGAKAQVTACQYRGKKWNRVLTQPFPAVMGKNGIAAVGEKKEGDMKTPVGLYPLGEAFGTQPRSLKMDYKYITPEDKFVDDINSKQYNTWVHGPTDAKSYENMLIEPYQMGMVVNYNMNPVIAGAGSAIFIHLWRSLNSATHGCIAMDKPHLSALLYWVDKKQHPYIYITN